jgi:Zc3h12a-like Ribonuclease NYN domain
MVRPRLVQEGLPITGGNDDHPRGHHDGLVASQTRRSYHTAIGEEQPTVTEDPTMMDSSERSNDVLSSKSSRILSSDSSSLQRAAMGRSAYTPNTSHRSRYHAVIGGGDDAMALEPTHHFTNSVSQIPTSYTAGHEPSISDGHFSVYAEAKMEGVEDHEPKPPQVVIDGANIAYAYAEALESSHSSSNQSRRQPDARGIEEAVSYWVRAGLRCVVVLPQPWHARFMTPRSNALQDFDDHNHAHRWMSLFSRLQGQNQTHCQLILAPSRDDDDAYTITVAQRENRRANERVTTLGINLPHLLSSAISTSAGGFSTSKAMVSNLVYGSGFGPAFILSNDHFRDAQARDASGSLGRWLNEGTDHGILALTNAVVSARNWTSPSASVLGDNVLGPGRISFTFGNLGRLDDHGDPVLDFIPNPRHPLVASVEGRAL